VRNYAPLLEESQYAMSNSNAKSRKEWPRSARGLLAPGIAPETVRRTVTWSEVPVTLTAAGRVGAGRGVRLVHSHPHGNADRVAQRCADEHRLPHAARRRRHRAGLRGRFVA
jgi:hypothetical protein